MISLKLSDSAGVLNDGLDLEAVPDNSGVGPQNLNILWPHGGNRFDVPIGEGRPKAIPLVEYHHPGEARLEDLQAHHFEQAVIVVDLFPPDRVYVPIP